MPPKSDATKRDLITGITGLLLAVGGLTAALDKFVARASVLTEKRDPALVVVLACTLGGMGLILLLRAMSRKSRLIRPEVFYLDPNDRNHLRGRDDDVRSLREAARSGLTFLEGESGAGKTAVIRSGLIPALRAQEIQILPLYINSYGEDWEVGPEMQLATTLWQALSPDQRTQLDIKTLHELRQRLWTSTGHTTDEDSAPTPQKALDQSASPRRLAESRGVVRRLSTDLGITALVIFDQFDDYQTQYQDALLRKGKWLTTRQLTVNKSTRNSFWTHIAESVRSLELRCLFVTRSDTPSGALECVRFVEPEIHYLQRLEPAFLNGLLSDLVESTEEQTKAISNSDSGWQSLKDRLVADLAAQGRILPIQARTALRGLVKLPQLSVACYNRAGSIEGLELFYVQDGISAAATACDVTVASVSKLLGTFVDDGTPESPRTRALSAIQIAGMTDTDYQQVSRILGVLEQRGVELVRVRVTTESDGANGKQWSLYHDYLARPVAALRRKSDRFQQLLVDGESLWRRASGLLSSWRALLTPAQLTQIFVAALFGRVRVAGFGLYLILSMVRLLPIVVAAAVIITVSCKVIDDREHHKARIRVLSLIKGPPEAVSVEVKNLKAVRRHAIPLLRDWRSDPPSEKLRANLALGCMGEIKADDLVSSVPYANPRECGNFVQAMSEDPVKSLAAIKAAFNALRRESPSRSETVAEARLAILALYLGDESLAQGMCKLGPNPERRTVFIDTLAQWHASLARLGKHAEESDSALASALLLSSGGIAASNVNTTDGDDVCGNFSKLHQESGSGAVHSAAAWALSKWNEPIRNKDGKYKVPSEDSDWYVTTTGVTMIRIRKGQFERRREGAEKSQFVSITQEFELADREVSVERFERFADEMMKEWNGHHKEFSPTESHPIQKVGWTDAIRFCNWLSAKEGLTPCYRQLPTGWERIVGCLGFRLPTEAEWEYACRAGTTTQFACGGADDLSAYAVVNASRAAPCGSRMPNGWGLFDMHGNVWEWCEDSYGPYDDSVHVRDPVAIAKSSDYRVIRGGSFYALSNFLASEYRYADGPDIRFNNVGFRVARTRE